MQIFIILQFSTSADKAESCSVNEWFSKNANITSHDESVRALMLYTALWGGGSDVANFSGIAVQASLFMLLLFLLLIFLLWCCYYCCCDTDITTIDVSSIAVVDFATIAAAMVAWSNCPSYTLRVFKESCPLWGFYFGTFFEAIGQINEELL